MMRGAQCQITDNGPISMTTREKKATQSVPSFIQEITDVYAQEGEKVTLECSYAGNPAPDVVWYKDDKLVINTDNVKIQLKDEEKKTALIIKRSTKEDEASYVCKATSEIGLATTKAKLRVTAGGPISWQPEEDEEEEEVVETIVQKTHKKKKPEVKKAKETKEKVKSERVKIDKKTIQKEKITPQDETDERMIVDVEETQVLETTTTFDDVLEQPKQAKKIVPIQDSVITEATASLKTVDEKTKKILPTVEERAKVTTEITETITVTEVQPEFDVRDMKKKKKKPEKVKTTIVKGKDDDEEEVIITEVTVEKIIKEHEKNIAREVEELMDVMNANEFGPGESPLRELATIGFLVRQGVSVNEINESLYRTDKFPALRTPDAQNALVQLVERQGHGPLITQVLTEETTTDESIVAATVGFRAFMKMVDLQHATVEEVITHFAPDDFRPRAWEVTEAIEVEIEQHATQRIEVIEETEIRVMGESRLCVIVLANNSSKISNKGDFYLLLIVDINEIF